MAEFSLWGRDCGFTKVVGNRIQKVLTQDGKAESKLYKDLVDHIKSLSEEELDYLKDQYKSWEGDYIRTVDEPKELALALYGSTKSENFESSYKGSKDDLGEPTVKEALELLTPKAEIPTDTMAQKPGTEGSKMSAETQKGYEEFVARAGFKTAELAKGLTDKDGNKITSNAITKFVHKLILLAKGKEAAIGEEASHVAVRMVKEKDPALFKKMMNSVSKYALYAKVVEQYSNDPDYQLADGKPNIPKLKEETIGKIFNELVINRLEGSTEKPELLIKAQDWWDNVKNFFRNLIQKLGFDPSESAIDKAAKQFTKGTGTFKDVADSLSKMSDKKMGESFQQFADRAIPNFKEIAKGLPDKTALVTHGTVISLLKNWKENGYKTPTTDTPQIIENGHIEHINYDGKDIYLVRHGESLANKEGGEAVPETPITDKGKEQADSTADKLKALGVENITSTNTARTKATAGVIADKLGLQDNFSQISDTPVQDQIHNELTDEKKEPEKIELDNNESYYQINGRKITNRVTSIAKKYLEGIFKNKTWLKDKIQDAINEMKKSFGTGGHKDIENILERGIDKETGLRKEDDKGNFRIDPKDNNYTPTTDPDGEGGYYDSLGAYLFGSNTDAGVHTPGLLDDHVTFPKGTRFYWEKKVYDPNRDLAGTIDFMAVTPEGKVHLFDWKFMGSLEKNQSIRDYMKKSYDIQMENYIDILKKNYGVKEVGQARIIPISVKYSEKVGHEGEYVSLRIGDVDYKNVSHQDEFLLPYATSSEKSSNEKVNTLVQQLTAMIAKLRATPGAKEDDIVKLNKVHNLERALLFIRLSGSFKPYLDQVKIVNQEGYKNIKALLDNFKNIKFNELKYDQFSAIIEPINDLITNLEVYQHIGDFSSYFDQSTPEGKAFAEQMLVEEKKVRNLLEGDKNIGLIGAKETFKQYFSAFFKDKTPQDILDPQKKLETIGAWGRPLSKSQLTTSQAFYKMNDYRQHIVENQTNDALHSLESIEKGIKDWGSKKGLTSGKDVLKAYTDLLEKKDAKGKGVNRLISQIDRKFHEELSKRLDKKEPTPEDIKWVKDNIDVKAFKDWADEYKITRYQEIKDLIIPGNAEAVEQQKEAMRNHTDKITDYSKDYAWTQAINVRRFPKTDIWHSKEYKELLKDENKQVKALYDFILETNELATKHGYIESIQKRTLLPWIEKSLAEKAVLGGKWNALNKMLESITANKTEGDSEIYDPLTQKVIPQLQKFFTHDNISTEVKDKEGERDYSGVSDEMLKNAAIFRYKVLDYNAKKEVEELTQGLLAIEKYKGMLQSTTKGKLTGYLGFDKDNLEVLEKQIKQMFYDQKVLSTFDLKGGKVTIDGKEREYSGQKALNTVKAVYSLDVLGFNAVTSIFRAITTNLAGMYTANQYYTTKEFLQGLYDFSGMRVFKNDHKLTIGMLKDFLPVEENLHEAFKDLSASKASGADFQGILMKWVKSAHNIVQYSNFLAHMKNNIIINGKLVNAREYYRESSHDKRYSNQTTDAEKKIMDKNFDSEVKKLIEEHGIIKKAKFNESTGRVDYEGLDMNDFSVAEMKSTLRVMGRKLSGNISENDESLIRSNALARQMFLFTNWLPQAIDIRFGGLAYNEGIDAYEYGRFRMMGKALFGIEGGILSKIKGLSDMTKANAKGIEHLHKMYLAKAEKYKKETGQELKMSKEEFYDLFRQNMKIQGRELLTLLSMAGMVMGAGAILPKKKDDPDHQGYYTFMKRILNRCEDELMMFYNPASFVAFADSSKFPMLSYLVSLKRASVSILQEVYGVTIQDQKMIDNAKVIKHTFGAIPVFKEGLEVINILDPEMGNYLGMQYHSEIMGKK